MKKIKLNKVFLTLMPIFFFYCSKSDETCNFSPEINVSIIDSHPCEPTGKVNIISPIDATYLYKIDQGNYQNNPSFENIGVGSHILQIKNKDGCETSKEIVVNSIPKGNKFFEVENILKTQCSSCHSGFNPQAGIDFTRSCDILNHWDRIQARAIMGNPTTMPPTGLIPLEDRNKLLDWINNGSKYEE